MLVKLYFYLVKNPVSLFLDFVVHGFLPRKGAIAFNSPSEMCKYWLDKTNNVYTGDPLRGAFDFYLNPKVLQGAIESGSGFSHLNIDCDDVALWAYMHSLHMPGTKGRLVTILDSSGKWGHHVICLLTHKNKYYVMDTNGLHEVKDHSPEVVCDLFSKIYKDLGFIYKDMIDTPVPFSL